MAYGKYYSPAILSRLDVLVGAEDWTALQAYLEGLSHRDFRMAGEAIGLRFMPVMRDEAFWSLFYSLLVYHSKAFLVTMLKSVPLRKASWGGFTLHHNGFIVVSNYLNTSGTEVDRAKFISFMLTVFDEQPDELSFLFERLHVDTPRARLEYLLRGTTTASSYLLFRTLRQLEHDRDLLVRCGQFLMRQGDSRSFNMASLIRAYFDLPQLEGTFSLRLAPYQLGRLEAYETFRKVVCSI